MSCFLQSDQPQINVQQPQLRQIAPKLQAVPFIWGTLPCQDTTKKQDKMPKDIIAYEPKDPLL